MLNNHLISIQSVYKYCALSTILALCSCSSVNSIQKPKKSQAGFNTSLCQTHAKSVDEKHLIIATQIKSSVMVNCFKNYLRFEKNKKQVISTCNQLAVRKRGDVSFVQVTNANKRSLPKDLKMCIEQEYWKMDFSGLQLDQSYIIKFPLNFSSI